ncbi:hypothetical protein EW146_g9988 [Bondarzewia mesenterica]|uniref:Uncharacterized protein n=1 Tax=Bondarzewia mesenterica TaxID=1095465 RepID=A0A4S4L3C7_9AGAM|nr:hypothetical protein EW146_g9988 [Bondarzewia mesenterica]
MDAQFIESTRLARRHPLRARRAGSCCAGGQCVDLSSSEVGTRYFSINHTVLRPYTDWAKVNEDRTRRAERARVQHALEEEQKEDIAERLREEASQPAY